MRKVLIANRGEIAVRIIHACRNLGLGSVAVYSEADAGALHACLADEAWPIGPAPAAHSYLVIERLLEVARAAGADAVHPGYGFLAESAAFARAVEQAGLIFVGPRPETIALMGSKTRAREHMERQGVPGVPGSPAGNDQELAAHAARLGYPVLVKAVAGGGGKGMRLVASAAELGRALELARTEARQSFGDPALYLERALPRARHVEIQVLGDGRGKVVHLLERECSIQRRHQKLIEETPSPAVDEELRRAMGEAAVRACAALGYRGAGTVEFLLEPDGRFWFLEMNTRLQVEHPITEARTGIDLVAWQLRLAAGEPLALEQERIGGRGHAIECRICAEDPAREFLPSAGRLLAWLPPAGPGLRLDSGVRAGDEVTLHYDPLLAKLIAWDESRDRARQRLLAALDRFVVLGLQTNLPLLRAVLAHPAFTAGETHTRFLEEEFGGWQPAAAELADEAVLAAAVLDHLQAARPSSDAGGLRHGTAAAGEPYSPWRGPHRRSAVIGAGLEQGTAGGGAR